MQTQRLLFMPALHNQTKILVVLNFWEKIYSKKDMKKKQGKEVLR